MWRYPEKSIENNLFWFKSSKLKIVLWTGHGKQDNIQSKNETGELISFINETLFSVVLGINFWTMEI